ncbi:hypothetical protein [Sphingopyxis sp. KK2]|uniref:hypothetical protein n=1 Tax=Sphingopyxis sp. KK2 TaxID=1855727 RepID=UPI00097E628E|nr:hypothetical protein [Sphingopyxis sp. KK2]
MSDTIIRMHAADLPGIAEEARRRERLRTLEALETSDGKNYAVYDDPTFSPDGDIVILAFPSVDPAGSSKLCDGHLKIGPNILKVTAYRLPAG